MKKSKKDWRYYLRGSEVDEVRKAEEIAAKCDEQKKAALLSIHYIRNAACQRRRYAIGKVQS